MEEKMDELPVQISFRTPTLKDGRTRGNPTSVGENLIGEVRGLLTFDDCPSILRASRLPSLLSQFGTVFSSARGSASTYQMSSEVESIDFFLSHNWAISRWKKYLCLVLHFNFLPAMVATAGALAITAVLSAKGYLPLGPRYQKLEGWKDPAWREGYVCQVMLLPVFLCVLFFWQDLLRSAGYKAPSAFLDKTCIHQEDPYVMKMGIERLGAFINRSDQMLILYTELYLTKLWTSYEVAASLALNGANSIRVLDVHSGILLLCMLVATWGEAMFYIIIHQFEATFLMFYVVMLLLGCFCFRDLRKWQVRRHELECRISSFDVRECTCAVEADRPVVYKNISRLMRASGSVNQIASQEEALDVFNTRVRNELMQAFRASIGSNAFKYHHYLMQGCLISGGKGVDMLVSIPLGLDPRYIICFNLNALAWACGIWPLLFVLLGRMAASKTHLKGWRNALWHIVGVGVPFAIGFVLAVLMAAIRYRAETSDFWLGLAIVLWPAFTIAALRATNVRGCCSKPPEDSSEDTSTSGTKKRGLKTLIRSTSSMLNLRTQSIPHRATDIADPFHAEVERQISVIVNSRSIDSATGVCSLGKDDDNVRHKVDEKYELDVAALASEKSLYSV